MIKFDDSQEVGNWLHEEMAARERNGVPPFTARVSHPFDAAENNTDGDPGNAAVHAT
jgi:hypothetical protein